MLILRTPDRFHAIATSTHAVSLPKFSSESGWCSFPSADGFESMFVGMSGVLGPMLTRSTNAGKLSLLTIKYLLTCMALRFAQYSGIYLP